MVLETKNRQWLAARAHRGRLRKSERLLQPFLRPFPADIGNICGPSIYSHERCPLWTTTPRQNFQIILARCDVDFGNPHITTTTPSKSGSGRLAGAAGLAALVQNALPDAVDGLPELWSGCGSNLVQVRLGRTAHDQDVLFRHAAHDRIAIEQPGRLGDWSNSP